MLTIAAIAASVAYVAVTVLIARHVTFYWDDYYLLLTLDDRGLSGALMTGINGNWWPLATVGLWLQVVAFGSWYPAYLATNAILVVATAWASWFALEPLARRRPWLLAAALTVYACSLGLVVNVTVMTMSWPLAAALAMTSAALAARRHPWWAWGAVLALAFLAESGLFAALATTVAAVIVVTRAAARGWTRPPRADLLLAGTLVVVGLIGTAVGYAIATADPINYYETAGSTGDAVLAAIDVGQLLQAAAAYIPSWMATPLLAPMVILPKALPWLVVLVSTYGWALTAVVVVAVITVAALWRHRHRYGDGRERWARLFAALALTVPVVETALILGATRGGTGLAPRYAILWILPAAAAWAVLLQCRTPRLWLRAVTALASTLLAVSAVAALVALPWTFRAAFDIDKDRWDRSPNQAAQLDRCREDGVGIADQQVSPGLRDDLLCQVARFVR